MGAPKVRRQTSVKRVRDEKSSESKMEIRRLTELISQKIKKDPSMAKKAAQILEELLKK